MKRVFNHINFVSSLTKELDFRSFSVFTTQFFTTDTSLGFPYLTVYFTVAWGSKGSTVTKR